MADQKMQAMQLIAPDIAQEQNQLSRRQQLADMLRKQSFESSGGTEVINGWAVKKSPYEALTKMAQALAANYVQDKTDARQLELAGALQGRMGDAFDKMAGGSVGAGGMSQPQMEGRTDANAMGPQAGVPAPNAVQESSQMQVLKNQAKAAYLMGNNELSNKLIENYSLMTDAAKRDRELGITPTESKSSELAKRLKEGVIPFLPGQTNRMPDGSMVVAPNFDTGVAGGFDKQGNPVATEIPRVAAIAASRAGGIKEAEASVADRFGVPVAVNLAGGPRAMTPAQQRAAANGGEDPAYPNAPPTPSMIRPPNAAPQPRGKSMFSSTEIEKDQTAIFQGEMRSAQERLSSAKTPEESARAKSDLDNLGREMSRLRITPNTAPQSVGIKLQDDAQKAKEIATAQADVVRDTSQQKEGKLRGQLTAGVDRAIELLKSGPTASGAGSLVDTASNFFGKSTKGADLASQLDTLSGWITSNVPRMEGPQSDKDVANYRIMGAEVGDRTKPISQRLAAADELKRLQDKYAHLNGGSDNSGGTGKSSSVTPLSVKSLLDKYK